MDRFKIFYPSIFFLFLNDKNINNFKNSLTYKHCTNTLLIYSLINILKILKQNKIFKGEKLIKRRMVNEKTVYRRTLVLICLANILEYYYWV